MKYFILVCGLLVSMAALSQEKMKMNFINEDITKIIQAYSKSSAQKFIVDSTVRGKITILNSTEVTLSEAFNQLSAALALNGFAIIKQDDVMIVRNARSAQRDSIEVSTEVPSVRPERMFTWIVTLKHTQAMHLMQNLRMMTSMYGEMSAISKTNQLVFTDWTPNINRIAEMIKQLDRPADPSLAKIISANEKDAERYRKEFKEKTESKKEIKKDSDTN